MSLPDKVANGAEISLDSRNSETKETTFNALVLLPQFRRTAAISSDPAQEGNSTEHTIDSQYPAHDPPYNIVLIFSYNNDIEDPRGLALRHFYDQSSSHSWGKLHLHLSGENSSLLSYQLYKRHHAFSSTSYPDSCFSYRRCTCNTSHDFRLVSSLNRINFVMLRHTRADSTYSGFQRTLSHTFSSLQHDLAPYVPTDNT